MRDPDEDRLLLQRVALGDSDAMRRLYKRHHDGLYGFIRMRCGNDATTSDVVHDAMLGVWRGAGRFSGRSSVRTWIFAIARNKLLDHMRRSSQLTYMDEMPDVVDDSPDVTTVLAAAQDSARLHACLARLKKVQLAAIRLAFFDGLRYDDIAEIEGVPAGTVKTRIHHAKQALMHCLSQRA